ncbi:hypothetical protein BpHYR1_004034 [Brachionus plicatilis]|uniref:Uncharacterized protein n=1 Tax=Brachionus plicatilis TaxID=10195 RepID=A0A3M7T2Z4_BRAPC|nr:hypothetical protein BpHYR1_004034 [Brachionus plicatilis]
MARVSPELTNWPMTLQPPPAPSSICTSDTMIDSSSTLPQLVQELLNGAAGVVAGTSERVVR